MYTLAFRLFSSLIICHSSRSSRLMIWVLYTMMLKRTQAASVNPKEIISLGFYLMMGLKI